MNVLISILFLSSIFISHNDHHFKNELDSATGWATGPLPVKIQGWVKLSTDIPVICVLNV